MKPYRELNALPAEAFLNPENFRGMFDTLAGGVAAFERGLAQGRECQTFAIACNSTWSGRTHAGASVSRCEGIGYHANTGEFLRGVLASGCRVIVYREGAAGPVTIQEAAATAAA